MIEHLRGQAAYRQQQAKRLTELSRPAAPRLAQRPPWALELIRSVDRAVETPAPTSASEALQAPPSGFSPEQLAALSAPLDRANLRQREQGRSKVHYREEDGR